MAIDPSEIELTPRQKELIAQKAERLGVDYSAVLDEWLETTVANGAENQRTASVFQRMKQIGAIGCVEGPGDLSTNSKHMEGFGVNASQRRGTSN